MERHKLSQSVLHASSEKIMILNYTIRYFWSGSRYINLKRNILFTDHLCKIKLPFFLRQPYTPSWFSEALLRFFWTILFVIPSLSTLPRSKVIFTLSICFTAKSLMSHTCVLTLSGKLLIERRWDATDLAVEQVVGHGVPLRRRRGRGPVLYAAILCFRVGRS